MTSQTLMPGGDADRWDQAIYAFLAEKGRRSGSMRTVESYSRMLYRFFDMVGKPPDQVEASAGTGVTVGEIAKWLPVPGVLALGGVDRAGFVIAPSVQAIRIADIRKPSKTIKKRGILRFKLSR